MTRYLELHKLPKPTCCRVARRASIETIARCCLLATSILFSVTTHSQVNISAITPEFYRNACEEWLPIIAEYPSPQWVEFSAIESDSVLEAVEVDGLVIPFFSLDDYQEAEHSVPEPTMSMFMHSNKRVLQAFQKPYWGNGPVLGQEFVTAGLIDEPLNHNDLNRRSFGLSPDVLDCGAEFPSNSQQMVFAAFLDLWLQFTSLPFDHEVIDLGNQADHLIVNRDWKMFSLYRFADDGRVFSYTYNGEVEQEFEDDLNRYVWALENAQYNINQNVIVTEIYRGESTARESQAWPKFQDILDAIISEQLADEEVENEI